MIRTPGVAVRRALLSLPGPPSGKIIQFYTDLLYIISIWQLLMVSRAASCFSGVTPAQHAESTVMGASGNAAFSSRALLTTQISVQSPMTSSVNFSSPQVSLMSFGSSIEPKVGFSTAVKPFFSSAAATARSGFQPSVPFMQCGTGRRFPSEVCK